jgi:hypothetical protein
LLDDDHETTGDVSEIVHPVSCFSRHAVWGGASVSLDLLGEGIEFRPEFLRVDFGLIFRDSSP